MDRVLKRTLSFVMALAMVLSLVPAAGIYVHATEAEEPVVTEPVEQPPVENVPLEETNEVPSEEPAEEPEAEEPAEDVEELIAEEVSVSDTQTLAVAQSGTLKVAADGLTVTWEHSAPTDKIVWSASGNSITCSATGGGTSTITLKNDMGKKATLAFKYQLSGEEWACLLGEIDTYDEELPISSSYSKELENGDSISIELVAPSYEPATFSMTEISLIAEGATSAKTTFSAPENGSYTVDGEAVTQTVVKEAGAGTKYVLEAEPASGYQFFGWYNETTGKYLSYNGDFTLISSADVTVKPVFVDKNKAIFSVGDAKFYDLTEAGAAASAGETIILLNNGTVTGNHTIPAGVTLLIPHKDEQTEAYGEPGTISESRFLENCIDFGKPQYDHAAWTKPTTYRELTLAAGATIAVEGTIEVSAQHASAAAASTGGKYGGSPTGPIGYIKMETGSQIVVKSGATLLCWGYIYGDGTVTAKNGAKVYENFQIMDFRGGNQTAALATTNMVFPFSQYYVQNIEVATKFEYGSSEYVATSLFASGYAYGAAIKFIGDGAMFRPENGAYVVKEYDPKNDVLNVETNGNCALAPITVDLSGLPIADTETGGLDSGLFVLPITNNINITINSGTASLKQSIMLLPGSGLTINNGATLAINNPYQLQVVDKDNWTTGYRITDDGMVWEEGLEFCYPGEQFVPIEFSPTKTKTRSTADLVDAVVDINGTVITEGFMCSTVLWDVTVDPETEMEIFAISGGGANIISSQKTGVLAMNGGAATPDPEIGVLFTYLFEQSKGENGSFYMIPMASAQLRNGDGTLLDTTGAVKDTTYKYCKIHDAWYLDSAEDEHENCKLWDITWVVDGIDLTQEVPANTVPTYPKGTPTKEGFTFAGWSSSQNGPILDELPAATGPATYHAIFTEVTDITVTAKGSIKYTVSGSVVTVDHSAACKVGYLKNGKYEVIPAVANSDGTYSFTTPVGVTKVLLVVKGDVSGDGKLTAKDRTSALKSLLNSSHNKYSPLSEAWQEFAADVTDDGKLSTKDRTLVLKGLLNANNAKYSPLSW